MVRRVILSGVLGGIVMMLWAFVANAGFRLRTHVDMKRISEEARLYQVLKETVAEPGGYVVNPAPTSEVVRDREPVFAVRYSGLGHEAAGWTMLWQFALWMVASAIAAWLSSRVNGRVVFFMVLGLLFAVFSELPRLDIGGYPLGSVLLLAGNTFVAWTLAGLVIAWQMRPIQPARMRAGVS